MSTETSNRYESFNEALIAGLRANQGQATSGPFQGRPVLILTTTGAKSGQRRENPLAFTRTGDDYVVIASKGGSPENPSWYHNLVANPEVTVEVLGEKFTARARVATGEEHERLFAAQAKVMPGFADYQRRTARKIPVIVLHRRG
ncbi:MAG: nitroreductase family deazaflavin-dependent oxidoreductase [Chloroflexi bacterium]|nr:MAG: nitroreductase family deazaflavin-dependent oxidoreductase [Chloroflexota bacterium]